jgi:2-oxoglutarate dehydrogenase E2 component (dihydrolipoamide succinyltransferase)
MSEHVVSEGDTVAVGALIARVEAGSGAPAQAAAPQPAELAAATNPAGPGETPAVRDDPVAPHAEGDADDDRDLGSLTLSPAVRRVVLEHGLDPSKIKGTGKDGRLTKDDVLAAAKAERAEGAPQPAAAQAAAAPVQSISAPATGERREERVRMTRSARPSPAA